MIIMKTLKNGKKKISSTYFDDIKLYRDMLRDNWESLGTGAAAYSRKYKDIARVQAVQLSAIVQQMLASKQGCWEVSEYAKNYKGDLNSIILDYGPAQPSEDYDEMQTELMKLKAKTSKTEEDITRIDELTKKIKEYDDFTEKAFQGL